MMEPTTEAGKRVTTAAYGLLDGFKWLDQKEWDRLTNGIAAIEAEAVATERARIVAAVKKAIALHEPVVNYGYEEFRCTCGWDRDKRPRDSYMAHVRKAVLRIVGGDDHG